MSDRMERFALEGGTALATGSADLAGLGIDLMDLPVARLPHPERAFGPSEV